MVAPSDLDSLPGISRTSWDSAGHREPPPLPPRAAQKSHTLRSDPPPYTEDDTVCSPTHLWSAQDPRSSSTQSLVPENLLHGDKRRLLLIYIHGFMGNETSFQSFPAHVHNLVTGELAETHQVHTKIYPRYKSRKAIEFARDDFSKWLSPHESSETDVILIGHSMGGLLAAEVALLGQSSNSNNGSFRHRILGTINFDTPFLGMHPGVIGSGIGSLFRPGPSASEQLKVPEESRDLGQGSTSTSLSTDTITDPATIAANSALFSDGTGLHPTQSSTCLARPTSPSLSPTNDPNYNPPFPNDPRNFPRKGWENALHFINKHSDGLVRATRSYVTSYFEFGGCLADYNELRTRYSRLKTLEESGISQKSQQRGIRFVNYYTASTGRPRRPKSRSISPNTSGARPSQPSTSQKQKLQHVEQELQGGSTSDSETRVQSTSPRTWVENCKDDEYFSENFDEPRDNPKNRILSQRSQSYSDTASDSENGMHAANQTSPLEETDSGRNCDEVLDTMNNGNLAVELAAGRNNFTKMSSLPPLPPQPQEPAAFDPMTYSEKDARKLAEKEHSRQLKSYQRAIKDRDKAILDRLKLLQKREREANQSQKKQLKREKKQIAKTKKEKAKREVGEADAEREIDSMATLKGEHSGMKPEKPKGDRKFCILPPKIDGEVDPCWVRVYMHGVDEVGAHCGLFFVGEHYEWLVNDVGKRIRQWVQQR